MKRSIIVALAGATIAFGTVASASAAPVDLGNPASAADFGSKDYFEGIDMSNRDPLNQSLDSIPLCNETTNAFIWLAQAINTVTGSID
ncbi:hypothetical protein [Rhodococcus kronopolitis]|uniref:Uncharacterized protein n=1 Tax=Rhodococcus kronopolitis TaxID=1460226 RepID=A0ABV9FUH8_9NOCA